MLRLPYLIQTQTHLLHRHLIFAGNINGADARVIGVNRGGDTVLQENLEWVGSVIGYVAGQVGFGADLVFSEIIHELRVGDGMHGMPAR